MSISLPRLLPLGVILVGCQSSLLCLDCDLRVKGVLSTQSSEGVVIELTLINKGREELFVDKSLRPYRYVTDAGMKEEKQAASGVEKHEFQIMGVGIPLPNHLTQTDAVRIPPGTSMDFQLNISAKGPSLRRLTIETKAAATLDEFLGKAGESMTFTFVQKGDVWRLLEAVSQDTPMPPPSK